MRAKSSSPRFRTAASVTGSGWRQWLSVFMVRISGNRRPRASLRTLPTRPPPPGSMRVEPSLHPERDRAKPHRGPYRCEDVIPMHAHGAVEDGDRGTQHQGEPGKGYDLKEGFHWAGFGFDWRTGRLIHFWLIRLKTM